MLFVSVHPGVYHPAAAVYHMIPRVHEHSMSTSLSSGNFRIFCFFHCRELSRYPGYLRLSAVCDDVAVCIVVSVARHEVRRLSISLLFFAVVRVR